MEMVEHIALEMFWYVCLYYFIGRLMEMLEHNALGNVLLMQLYYFIVRHIFSMRLPLEKFSSWKQNCFCLFEMPLWLLNKSKSQQQASSI